MIGTNIQILGAVETIAKLNITKESIMKAINPSLMKVAHLIERKTKQKCPVKTNRLRASYKVKVLNLNEVEVGTNVEYAPFVEFGTRKWKGKPHLRPAVIEAKAMMPNTFKTSIISSIGK